MKFELREEQMKKLNEWQKQQQAKGGKNIDVTGFRYTYTFGPCSLGMNVTVKDLMTGEELDLGEDF